jgi:hypothetical protein
MKVTHFLSALLTGEKLRRDPSLQSSLGMTVQGFARAPEFAQVAPQIPPTQAYIYFIAGVKPGNQALSTP